MSKKNIYFYSTSTQFRTHNMLYLNTVPLYLNAHLKNNRADLFNSINWSKIQLTELTKDQLIDDLKKFNIDILCVSLYVWNDEHIFELISGLKHQLKKELIIVAGGPSVDPHRNSEFFIEHPDIDYAVYAQGETAFATILDHYINNIPISLLTSKNLAWNDNKTNTIKVADYEFIRQKNFSPYIDSEELIKIITDQYKENEFAMPYETSKGCPYNCSFCDWTSGLSHKVMHRQVSVEDELNLLAKYKLTTLHISDANFGQHQQDIQIAEQLVKMRVKNNIPFEILNSNFSKLRKKEVFYIAELFIKNGIMKYPKFAFEDIHDEVLKNIERPCIPWQEHLEFVNNLKNNYPKSVYCIELMIGLPGQTRKSWEDTLCSFSGFWVDAYPWVLLPNSPASYDHTYREKMKIKTQYIRPLYMGQNNTTRAHLVTETYSYNFDDYVYFNAIYYILMNQSYFIFSNRRVLIDRIKSSSQFSNVLKTIKNYLLGNGTEQDIKNSFYCVFDDIFNKYTNWPDEIVNKRKEILPK